MCSSDLIDDETRRALVAQNPAVAEAVKPFIVGRDIRRYRLDGGAQYLLYMFHGVDASRYPSVLEHLRPFRDRLEGRATEQAWYELQQPQYRFSKYIDAPKIVFPDIAKGPRFAMDLAGHYGSNTIYFIPLEDYFLLGLLNSSLSRFYFESVCAGLEGGDEVYLRFFGQYMEGFPVPRICTDDRGLADTVQRMTALAKQRASLEAELAAASTPLDVQTLGRQATVLDGMLDRLVWELYGLTVGEIAVVRASFDER